MKKNLLFIISLLSFGTLIAQEKANNSAIFNLPEQFPIFEPEENSSRLNQSARLSLQKFSTFFYQKTIYPKNEKNFSAEGVAVIKFIVETDGSMSNLKMQRTPSLKIEKEIRRVFPIINAKHKWAPGLQKDIPVRTQISLPLAFQLDLSDIELETIKSVLNDLLQRKEIKSFFKVQPDIYIDFFLNEKVKKLNIKAPRDKKVKFENKSDDKVLSFEEFDIQNEGNSISLSVLLYSPDQFYSPSHGKDMKKLTLLYTREGNNWIVEKKSTK